MQNRRAFIGWWGSFPGGGPTIGDALSVRAVHSALRQSGWVVDVGCTTAASQYVPGGVICDSVDPKAYQAFAWICGPLIPDSSSQSELIHYFHSIPRIAAGVSILKGTIGLYRTMFDRIFARDGLDLTAFDLALGEEKAGIHPQQIKNYVGLALRGKQREYGSDRCKDELAESIIYNAVRGIESVKLETRLDRGASSLACIESGFAGSRIVLTTRLHGALLAIKHRVPFIAIDQVEGGEKVWSVLSDLRCPWVWRVDNVSQEEISAAVHDALNSPSLEEMEALYQRAQIKSLFSIRCFVKAMNDSVDHVGEVHGTL